MGPLFVLMIWAILFCIISLPLGLIGIIIANIYSNHKNVEVKKAAWFFAPTVLLFSFVGLLVAENVFYGIITGTGRMTERKNEQKQNARNPGLPAQTALEEEILYAF